MEKKYHFWGNIMYHYKNLLRWQPKVFWFSFLVIIPDVLYQLGTVTMTWAFAAGLEERWSLPLYLGRLAAISIVLVCCTIAMRGIWIYCGVKKPIYIEKYEFLAAEKKMNVDYDVLESKRFQDLAQKVSEELKRLPEKMDIIDNFLANLIGCIVSGSILAAENFWILLWLFFSATVQFVMLYFSRKAEEKRKDAKASAEREMSYLNIKSRDISAGKDIRLYHMAEWFEVLFHKAFVRVEKKNWEIWNWYFGSNVIRAFLNFIENLFVYGYLVVQIFQGELTISSLIYYASLISTLSGQIWMMEESFHDLGGVNICISCIRQLLELPERQMKKADTRTTSFVVTHTTLESDLKHKGHKDISFAAGQPVSIEFCHVFFRHPGADKDTLVDLNLKIKAGEKLAIVGLNGAGKTTFVKLLCRLYHPTKGKILLNGINIEEFQREEYFSLLSVLFQDSIVLPVSIAENVASYVKEGSKIHKERLQWAYRESGIGDKTDRLPLGDKTYLVREVWDNAVDLSGGERQKLLLARAIYKFSSVLILDEPTAAMDPIAEQEIYLHYSELAEGRTSIFISHRLSSTRFCDRIVLLKEGQIVEEGSHKQLLLQKGEYARLFEVQREYYRTGGKEHEKE